MRFFQFTDEVNPSIIMEYLALGNVEKQHNSRPITPEEGVDILHQSLLALQYLHERGIVHRDIKPANILFQSREPVHIKLADFGLATDASILQTHAGTYLYAAPEIWSGSNYTSAVDIWSIGLVAYQYVYGLPKPQRGPFHPSHWYKQLMKAVEDWDSDPLIDFLTSSMLKIKQGDRKSARECLVQVHALGLVNHNAVECTTPTEAFSSSLMMEARQRLGLLADWGSVESTRNPTGPLFVDDKALTENKVHPRSIVGTTVPETTKRQGTAPGDAKKSRKRQFEGSDLDVEVPIALQHSQGIQNTLGNLGEGQSEFFEMAFTETLVQMRKRDGWLNAVQILTLAGLDAHRRRQILNVMRSHTPLEEDLNEMSWVCFEHGYHLCRALELQHKLRSLLRHHYPELSFNARQLYDTNYLIGYFSVDGDKGSVMIRKLDFRVNATHLLREAGMHRQTAKLLRKQDINFDIVSGAAKYQGSYVSFPDALCLCEKYRLDRLKGVLTPHNPFQDEGLRPVATGNNLRMNNQTASQSGNTGNLEMAPMLPEQAVLNTEEPHSAPLPLLTEPSFSDGLFLPQLEGSVLEPVWPNLAGSPTPDTWR